MKFSMRALAFCGFVLLSGCANLQEVQDFTSESAKLSSYTVMVDYTINAYARTEPYLLPKIREREAAAEKMRKASRNDLISLQKAAASYMATLARLSGANAFSVDANIDKLSKSISNSPEFGVSDATVGAYSALLHKVSKWVLAKVQEDAVKQMINDGGDDFEKVVSGMGDVVRMMRKIHDNERKTVVGSLEMMIATTKVTSENYLVLALAQDRLSEKRDYYAKTDAIYEEAAKGIEHIKAGHHLMATNLTKLDSKEVREKLKQLRDDIKTVRDKLSASGI